VIDHRGSILEKSFVGSSVWELKRLIHSLLDFASVEKRVLLFIMKVLSAIVRLHCLVFLFIGVQLVDAGVFANVKAFIVNGIDRIRKRSKQGDAVGAVDVNNGSLLDTVDYLTIENEQLRVQNTALKAVIRLQKKQVVEAKKEKETIRREMQAQIQQMESKHQADKEAIREELKSAFEKQKSAMVVTFEEERNLLKQNHEKEVDEIKKEIMGLVEKKSSEIAELKKVNAEQEKELATAEKSKSETVKVSLIAN
jgi:hypothetical protein